MIGQLLLVVVCAVMMFVGFGLGHWSGYYKGRKDQLEEDINLNEAIKESIKDNEPYIVSYRKGIKRKEEK